MSEKYNYIKYNNTINKEYKISFDKSGSMIFSLPKEEKKEETEKMVSCDSCHKQFAQSEIIHVELKDSTNHYNICPKCYPRFFAKCEECGGHVRVEPGRSYTIDGKRMCYNCTKKKYRLCKRCENVILNEGQKVNCYYWCDSCYKKYAYTCEDCGKTLDKERARSYIVNVEDGEKRVICRDCLDNGRYIQCRICDNYFLKNDSFHYKNNDNYYCLICKKKYFTQCIDCEELCLKSEFIYNGQVYCKNCFNKKYFKCRNCESFYPNENRTEYDSRYYCVECHDSIRFSIQRYGYKPNPQFQGKGLYHFGIELEVALYENRDINKIAKTLAKAGMDFLYLKSDASIEHCGHRGFEIVTHPISWGWIEANPDKMKLIFDLKDEGFRSFSTKSCGMHVHIGVRQITAQQLHHLLLFVYNNEKTKQVIKAISLREEDDLQCWANTKSVCNCGSCNKNDSVYLKEYAERKKNRGYCDVNRRTAINLAHDNTVEFRFFRGTLNQETFYRNLEFVTAMLDYCKVVEEKDLGLENFMNFMVSKKNRKKKYARVIDFVFGNKTITDLAKRDSLSTAVKDIMKTAKEASVKDEI